MYIAIYKFLFPIFYRQYCLSCHNQKDIYFLKTIRILKERELVHEKKKSLKKRSTKAN